MRALGIVAAVTGLLAAAPPAGAQCYTAREGSPYDFATRGGTLFHTDFASDAVGDFPASLEFKAGAMEVARWRGRNALKASAQSAFVVPLDAPLPDRFTVEIGVVNRSTKQVGAETVTIAGGRTPHAGTGTVHAEYGPIMWRLHGGGVNAEAAFGADDADVCIGQEAVVRLSVDGPRVRLYADERRLASIPAARFLRAPGLVVSLAGRDDMDNAVYVTSIRVTGESAPVATGIAASSPAPAPAAAPGGVTATTSVLPASPAVAASNGTVESEAGRTMAAASPGDARAVSSVTAAPPAPANLQASYAGGGHWAFTWNAVAGAAGYEVWVTATECPSGCRVTLAGLADTAVVSATTFDYSGPVRAHVRALGPAGTPSSPSAAVVLPPTPRYKGRYRVTISGLRVNRETFDNPAEIDGKRDEVLVRAWARTFDAQQHPIGFSVARSRVHGDRNATSWSMATSPQVRIKAGSASLLGGLRTGDEHHAQPGMAPNDITFPLLVWDGILREGGAQVIVVPSVWEVDRAPDWQDVPLPEPERELVEAIGAYAASTYLAAATQQVEYTTEYLARVRRMYGAMLGPMPDWALATLLRQGAVRALALLPAERIAADSVDDALRIEALRIREALGDMGGEEAYAAAAARIAPLQSLLLSFYAQFAPTLAALMNNADRPIGIRAVGGAQQFDAQVVRLDFTAAERVANGAHGHPPGEIPVRYRDLIAGANGDYTLFLKVERLE